MSRQIITIDNSPNRTFYKTVTVNEVPVSLGFFLSYNTVARCWRLTIFNPIDFANYVSSIPLVCGGATSSNLLAQYEYLGIGSLTLEKIGNSSADSPDDTNLGTEFQLVWDD